MSTSIAENFTSSYAVLPTATDTTSFDLSERGFHPVRACVGSTLRVVDLSESTLHPSLNVSISDFDLNLAASTLRVSKQLSAINPNDFVLEASIHKDVRLIIHFVGEFSDDDVFTVQEVNINADFLRESAESDFVAATILAAIGLANEVRLSIPEVGFDLSLKFQSQPAEVSRMLQCRQIAYRVMVLERATNYKFNLPTMIAAEDVGHLAFIYYSIVKRSFVFPFSFLTYPTVPATRENLEKITALNSKTHIIFGPDTITKSFLGQAISLGDDGVFVIENAAIDNFDEIRERLTREDGRPVEVVIRSRSGQARYNLPSAPILPDAAWDEFTQKLIDLDSALDMRLVERYHALAAATLDGLSESEKKIAVTRPDLPIDVGLPSFN